MRPIRQSQAAERSLACLCMVSSSHGLAAHLRAKLKGDTHAVLAAKPLWRGIYRSPLALCAALVAVVCTAVLPVPVAAQDVPFLWRATKGNQTVVLWGTTHQVYEASRSRPAGQLIELAEKASWTLSEYSQSLRAHPGSTAYQIFEGAGQRLPLEATPTAPASAQAKPLPLFPSDAERIQSLIRDKKIPFEPVIRALHEPTASAFISVLSAVLQHRADRGDGVPKEMRKKSAVGPDRWLTEHLQLKRHPIYALEPFAIGQRIYDQSCNTAALNSRVINSALDWALSDKHLREHLDDFAPAEARGDWSQVEQLYLRRQVALAGFETLDNCQNPQRNALWAAEIERVSASKRMHDPQFGLVIAGYGHFVTNPSDPNRYPSLLLALTKRGWGVERCVLSRSQAREVANVVAEVGVECRPRWP
jgi:hypothetical protein